MKRKFKDVIGKFYQVYVQLRDAILIFLYLPITGVNDNDDGIDVVDDDLIWACFGDEEEECKGNVESVYAVIPLLCLPFRLFFRLNPYTWLPLLTAVPGVCQFISRHRILGRILSVLFNPLTKAVLVSVFRLVRCVVLFPLIRVPLVLILKLIGRILTLPIRLICNLVRKMYLPRVSESGQQFFKRLTKLNSLDVTLPPLWFDHPRLWFRGETKQVGRKRYAILVVGDVVDRPRYGVGNSWDLLKHFLKPAVLAFIRLIQLNYLVNQFPVAMENSKVVRNATSKSAGVDIRARFYVREVSSHSREIKGSLKDMLFGNYSPPMMVRHVLPCTLSLNEGPVHLRDAVLVFMYFRCAVCDGGDTRIVVDNDFIWTCLADEEEECEGDVERKELKEAVRVILSTPAVMST